MLVFSDKLSLPGPDALLGDLLSLAGGIFWAATMHRHQALAACPTSAPKSCCSTSLPVPPWSRIRCCLSPAPLIRDANAAATWALVFQSVYVVAITYVLWFWLMQRYPASGLSSFTFLTPVFGVLCGGLILGEPLGTTIFLALGADRRRAGHRQPARRGSPLPEVETKTMRDVLNDLEAGQLLSDPDPVRRAQIQMRTPLPKRFYEDVAVAPRGRWLRRPTRRQAGEDAGQGAARCCRPNEPRNSWPTSSPRRARRSIP